MKVFRIYWIAVFAMMLFFWSCNKDNDDETEIVPKYLVDSELTNEEPITSGSIQTVLNFAGFSDLAGMAKYDIQVYKVDYMTLFEGDSIEASGLIAVPVPTSSDDKFPILSFQHGTLFAKSEAPSENAEGEYMAYLASTGMVVAIPDYIGFGTSDQYFHPYMINQYAVNAVLDMIRASKEFIKIEKPCSINDKLFLFGYSQGGSATVGALSAIENDNANSDITVTAASAGGGAYDLNEFRSWIMKQQVYDKPSFVTYILESYSRYTDADVSYSSIFSDRFAAVIPGLIDGVKDEAEVNSTFDTHYVDEVFNDNFEDDSVFENDEVYASLRQAFTDNKIGAWSISTPLVLYFGTDDDWVPGEQSLRLYQEFQEYSVGTKVRFKQLSGEDHSTAFAPALLESIDWFLGI